MGGAGNALIDPKAGKEGRKENILKRQMGGKLNNIAEIVKNCEKSETNTQLHDF